MSRRALIARAAIWLIALFVGFLGGSVFTAVSAGACNGNVTGAWFQKLHGQTLAIPIHPKGAGTNAASRNPQFLASRPQSRTEPREPRRIDPFIPLVTASGTRGNTPAPPQPTSSGLQATSMSRGQGEASRLSPAGGVQPSPGFARQTWPPHSIDRSHLSGNVLVLLDAFGHAISHEADVLNYHGVHATSVSHNTSLIAGQLLSAGRSARSSGVPAPPRVMADQRDAELYQLSTGPIFDRHRAEDIVNQLLAAGLTATVSAQGQATAERFRVASEALLSSVAQHRVVGLADLHPEQELLDDGRLKLQFGIFNTEQEATALAETIRRRGYTATVEATGGVRFVVTVSPSPQAAVDRSIAIIRANEPRLTVRVQAAP